MAEDTPIGLKVAAGLVIAGLLIGLPVVAGLTTREVLVITVDDKERQVIRSGKSNRNSYLVWATRQDGEREVFEDSDSLVEQKFNSSELYGELSVGQVYRVEVVGWRIPFLSEYRNILRIVEEGQEDGAASE